MPTRVPLLSEKECKEAARKNIAGRSISTSGSVRYSDYTPEEKTSIGKYAAENGIAMLYDTSLGSVA